ncbi:MAG: DUF58 domain-containing protein [Cyclobacteriaceae bacterium]
MEANIKELLKPEILNTVDGLELVARILVEGFMSGANKSQTIGSGHEFSQHRSYEPGDDLRQFDWKMYARSEKYFIKQAEVETNITVKFMVDASHSMAYKEDGLSKLQYAKVMTASLAYLARKQRDSFGLFIVNENHVSNVHARFEQQQFVRFLQSLVKATAEGRWKKNGIEYLFDHQGKEMIIFFTDLYDDEGDLLHFISRLKTKRNEVIVFHLMGKREMELGFEGSVTFQDLENGSTLKVDTRAGQIKYSGRIQAWIKQSRLSLLEKNINYYMVSMGDNISEVLRDFLKIRRNFR